MKLDFLRPVQDTPRPHFKLHSFSRTMTPHPRQDDKGQTVEIKHPSTASPHAAWADPAAVAMAVPDTPMPQAINGVAVGPWQGAPTSAAGWEALVANIPFSEPPMPSAPGKKPAAGVVTVEPDGRVWVSAPMRTSRRRIEEVVREHWPSIKAKQERMRARYLSEDRVADDSECRLLGAIYRIEGDDKAAGAQLRIDGDRVVVNASIMSDPERLAASLDALQAEMLRQQLARSIPVWESRLGVRVSWWGIRRMRTRWGSCSVRSGRIRFSLNLGAEHPRQIEYLVLHELAHLLVPNHGPDFVAILDHHMPEWRTRRAQLNGRHSRSGGG